MTQALAPALFDGYQPPPEAFDELYDADGELRPHWRGFVDAVGELGAEEVERRRQEADRFLRENGVTFHLHSDDAVGERPWRFDPMPFLIDEADWAQIEAGLVQRARLLDGILRDLYGERSLLRRGLLPADLVLGHRGFLLPCDGICLRGPRQLVLYAADLARGPDGRMWVLADRTQVPFGMGYALENRTVTTRLFPGIFRDCNVRRLAAFFRALHRQLLRLHGGHGTPRIVLLSPGPTHPTYFEHAYLSAYLGYTVVQGSDLTVRDGAVWLKSLSGLERVDVILRRVDDHQGDPLELAADSPYGVPGLLEAARRGEVAIANPVGAGVLENPGLLPFLPALARELLGEELLLPSAATWWCGQPAEREQALAHLGERVVKPIYNPGEGGHSVFGQSLSADELEALRARILAAPGSYAVQERVAFSTAPSFLNRALQPRQAILRAFVTADGDGYLAMPGGLTRSAPERDAARVPSRAGGITKDTWVLSSRSEAHTSLWQERSESRAQPHASLPSRTAENLFWVGRYAERAEASTRLLRTIIGALTQDRDFARQAYGVSMDHLLRSLTRLTATAPGFLAEDGEALRDPRIELHAVATDAGRPGSLACTLQSLVRAAFAVRERWSNDTWRVVDDLHEFAGRLGRSQGPQLRQVHDELDQLITPLAAFAGLNKESMTREAGWLLLDMGRRVERGLLLISLLRSCLVPRVDDEASLLLWEAVLMTQESLITYRRRYRSYPELPRLLELLLLDRINPRGLAFQLHELGQHLELLPGERTASGLTAAEGAVLDAGTTLRLADVDDLVRAGRRAQTHRGLDRLLDRLEQRLQTAARAIEEHYFRHVADSRQLVPIPDIDAAAR